MNIDWSAFTPYTALAGGALIGLAAAMLALLNGRIAGIAGIVGGALHPKRGEIGWRLTFILGLLLAPAAWLLVTTLPEVRIDASYPMLILAGLVVGISTRYGAGCTSGHGVCGISRLSLRSIIATVAFMATGFLTVFVLRHLIGS
ncbi:MAG: YeeE/YedE family protein [Gammaproteobacteria bacterium]|nr:YeeE/YedE family protein [Gammaproteobacteria bacterium]